MILEIIENHKTIIQRFEIQKFKIVSKSYQLICKILFINNSQLFIRDFLLLDGEIKSASKDFSKNKPSILLILISSIFNCQA